MVCRGRSEPAARRGRRLLGVTLRLLGVTLAGALVSVGCSTFTTSSLERVIPDPTATPAPTVVVEPPPVNYGVVLDTEAASIGSLLVSPADGEGQYLFNADGNLTRIWTGTGEARSVELLPTGMLLRTVTNATLQAEHATGSVLLADRAGTAWACNLNEPWFGGLHLTDQALWLPPDSERGTAPWGSLALAAVRISSPGLLGVPDAETALTPVLIEIIPAIADDAEGASGGLLRSGGCGTARVVWELAAHVDELNDEERSRVFDPAITGIVDMAWSPEGKAFALRLGGLEEAWVIDGGAPGLPTEPDFDDSPASALLLTRWREAPTVRAVDWDGQDLLVLTDSDLVRDDLAGSSSTIEGVLTGSSGDLQVIDDQNIAVIDHDDGTITQFDRSGEPVWKFKSPVFPRDGEDDEIVDPSSDFRTGNATAAAVFYAADYPGLR